MSVDPNQSQRLIHCPPEVAYIPSSVSNSEKSTESLEWFYENLEMEHEGILQHGQVLTPQSPVSTGNITGATSTGNIGGVTTLQTQDLAQIISDNNRNNLARAQELLYFCGGQAKYGKESEKICEINASKWVADLESRTKFNFTDEHRIELAKQYTIGPAKEMLQSVLLISRYNWEGVKDKIEEIYPEEDDFVKYRRELYSATRKPGETIREFYIRTDLLIQHLIKMDLHCVVYVNQDQIAAFKTALPPAFESYLSGSNRKIPAEVYWCALRFIRNNPQYKLTDEDLRKEVKQTVNMALSMNPPPPLNQRQKKKRENHKLH